MFDLAPMYYRGAPAAIIMYDITNSESFDRAKFWVEKLIKEEWEERHNQMIIALVGNKWDLESQRKINHKNGQSYAEEKGLIFMETSAKDGRNVNELFENIASKLPLSLQKSSGLTLRRDDDEQPVEKSRRKCCK